MRVELDKTYKDYSGEFTITRIILKSNFFSIFTTDSTLSIDKRFITDTESVGYNEYTWIEVPYFNWRLVEGIGDHLSNINVHPIINEEGNYLKEISSCSHNWVTIAGFSSNYTDCSICGQKKEEV